MLRSGALSVARCCTRCQSVTLFSRIVLIEISACFSEMKISERNPIREKEVKDYIHCRQDANTKHFSVVFLSMKQEGMPSSRPMIGNSFIHPQLTKRSFNTTFTITPLKSPVYHVAESFDWVHANNNHYASCLVLRVLTCLNEDVMASTFAMGITSGQFMNLFTMARL